MQTVARIRMPENGVFECQVPSALALAPRDACIVEFDYGLDIGRLLELFGINEGASTDGRLPAFRVVRKAVQADEARIADNRALADMAKQAFQLSVSHEKGRVKVLHTRFSYGRDRLYIRYSAQIPVDLRRFVGQLQRDFKTHVDLWQVGVRDEAALVGCVGSCGRAVCCCTWQRKFQPVNVRMAREQDLPLNPVTINGSCGRLKCCLRFECEQYRVAGQSLPGLGSIVRVEGLEDAEGEVIGRNVLQRFLTVRTSGGRVVTASIDAVCVVRAMGENDRNREEPYETAGREWAEP